MCVCIKWTLEHKELSWTCFMLGSLIRKIRATQQVKSQLKKKTTTTKPRKNTKYENIVKKAENLVMRKSQMTFSWTLCSYQGEGELGYLSHLLGGAPVCYNDHYHVPSAKCTSYIGLWSTHAGYHVETWERPSTYYWRGREVIPLNIGASIPLDLGVSAMIPGFGDIA